MKGYFLRGVAEEAILVFRTNDPEELLIIINKLKTSRNKSIKSLANELELMYYENRK